ncbi:hypothetical protein LCER1_G000700 [Lachnellula cervina]|uniref:Uncharacterized protein n=1 Tax=Lachnellula cervina TaxID=1316786 RepID=A0A7D8UXQ9_9HELO|nr:hypothetical protein LCER1_G000700 [Lachnellula cervina]
MFKLPRISSKWRWPKFLIALMVVELGGSVAALALFGIAEPNLYRTKLWQIGADNGFNSSPKTILYAYANYRKIPSIPFVWSHTYVYVQDLGGLELIVGRITEFNVAISVLCTFIMIVKWVMFALHIWYPLLATVTNIIITALWIVSIYGQAGPDRSDPKHPSSIAWYVNKSCSYAKPAGYEHYCLMAKGTFAVTVFMMVIFVVNTVQGIWSMIPSASERAASKLEIDDMQTSKGKGASDSPTSDNSGEQNWEMKSHPKSTLTPYTPRTMAFNTLDRQLPLRAESHGARFA